MTREQKIKPLTTTVRIDTFMVKVLLVCFTQNENGGIERAWFESRDLPWHLAYPLTDDNIRQALAGWPVTEGVKYALFKWGIVGETTEPRERDN